MFDEAPSNVMMTWEIFQPTRSRVDVAEFRELGLAAVQQPLNRSRAGFVGPDVDEAGPFFSEQELPKEA